ncbi:MAG TPA: YraN family protein, partial [Thermoanaerobaculia bacterium]
MFARRSIATTKLGRAGERRAAWFYRLRGYRIVERNVRMTGGEIDLVVRRGKTLVIAEVKTRQSLAAGEGFVAVDRTKRERMIRLAG